LKIDEMKKMEKDAPAKELRNMLAFEKIPESFEGVLVLEEVKADAHGVECLFWTVAVGETGLVVQKYTPSQIQRIRQFAEINRINDTQQLIGKTMGFKKATSVNGREKPRWYPAAIL